jgi:KDO2-lipid IV(A) lauroyltransferase
VAQTLPGADPRWRTHGLNNGRIFRLTYLGVSKLPRAITYGIGHIGTWIAYRSMPAATAAVEDNLRVVFPDASSRELSRLALATYRNYARDIIDFMRSLAMSPEQVQRLFVTSGIDGFYQARDRGLGTLIVTGHFGNWELGGVLMRHLNLPLDVVTMPEVDEQVNEMRRDFRQSLGIGTIEVRQSLDTALQIRSRLSANRSVAMLMDRHVDRDRIEVSLLGRRAYFLRTPALLAYLTGAPIIPCFIVRRADGRFDMRVESAIDVARTQDRQVAVRDAAQRFADVLGRHILAKPECWYQFYSYWKTQHDTALEEDRALAR